MLAPLHDARQAYLRLASTVGHIPLTLLVSLLAVTAIAWAFTLYQPFAMSASMGSAMGEMEGMDKTWRWTAWLRGGPSLGS